VTPTRLTICFVRRAVLWRAGVKVATPLRDVLAFGDLQVDGPRREVHKGDKAVRLTRKEFELRTSWHRAPGRHRVVIPISRARPAAPPSAGCDTPEGPHPPRGGVERYAPPWAS
jgi:hypothetical protein